MTLCYLEISVRLQYAVSMSYQSEVPAMMQIFTGNSWQSLMGLSNFHPYQGEKKLLDMKRMFLKRIYLVQSIGVLWVPTPKERGYLCFTTNLMRRALKGLLGEFYMCLLLQLSGQSGLISDSSLKNVEATICASSCFVMLGFVQSLCGQRTCFSQTRGGAHV